MSVLTSLLPEKRRYQSTDNVQEGGTQIKDGQVPSLPFRPPQDATPPLVGGVENRMEQSGQLAEKLLELAPLDYDQPRAHQGVENGREEEHVQNEGGQVAPHPQQVDELHQIHRSHRQHEGELAPAGARSGVQHGQVSPHPHVDAHQADILDCHCSALSISSLPADPLQTVLQSAGQMSFILHQLSPSRRAICGLAIDTINGSGSTIRNGSGIGKWEMGNGHWDWELRPFGTCRRTAYNLANWLMMSVM